MILDYIGNLVNILSLFAREIFKYEKFDFTLQSYLNHILKSDSENEGI